MSMYLSEVWLENNGPLTNCHVKMPFAADGRPLPIIVVGPNGSGKSIFLSYIVDALVEFGKLAFEDVVPVKGPQTPYLRYVGPTTATSGKAFSLALLNFKAGDRSLNYCEKTGVLDSSTYSPEVKSIFSSVWTWPKEGNHKHVSADKTAVEDAFKKGAFVFFPSGRREIPDWLNPESLHISLETSRRGRFTNRLDKPIWVESCSAENAHWILDVFLDSQVDLNALARIQAQAQAQASQEGPALPFTREIQDLRNRQVLRQARQNVEAMLRQVLQDPRAELILNLRQVAPSRLSIQMGDGRIIPSLQSLSAGQSLLFNLFTTIVRYADQGDINMSFRLGDITGIVVIDEIDAHLHTLLQHDCVPKLLGLFPKVQFIFSSHAPLVPLGMEKAFGQDGVTVIELPAGKKIGSERFAEFDESLDCYQRTMRFEQRVEERIVSGATPLVLTEGPLDPMYIRTGLRLLGENDLLESLEIEFVGIEEPSGTRHGGDTGLNHFRNVCEANPSLLKRPTLLLYDCDTSKPQEQVGLLWARSIPKGTTDSRAKKGTENLLPASIFEARFYRERIYEGDFGEKKLIQEFDKTGFCKWICDERKNAADFAGFHAVVEILKAFRASAAAAASPLTPPASAQS